jgi:dihydropteroate synthase
MMRQTRWKIGDTIVDLSQRSMIMGVLNVTPDSFSDGGEFFSVEKAVARGLQIAAEGAQILDIGGGSTRPGAEPVTTEEELRRVIPVIERLRDKIGIFISVDTSKSDVAEAALDAGATIVNDVTGGRGDARMMQLVVKKNAAFIIMHMQGNPRTMQVAPRYDDVVAEVADFFRQQYERALECGIDPMAMAFDPGIGFGKTLAHNLELLANLERLRVENQPIAIGVSRKAFLGKLTKAADARDRVAPTVALTSLLRSRGANVFRVHDVLENMAALRITEAVLEH